jgi:hypothetical protein
VFWQNQKMLKHQILPKRAKITDDKEWMDEQYKMLRGNDSDRMYYYDRERNQCVTTLVYTCIYPNPITRISFRCCIASVSIIVLVLTAVIVTSTYLIYFTPTQVDTVQNTTTTTPTTTTPTTTTPTTTTPTTTTPTTTTPTTTTKCKSNYTLIGDRCVRLHTGRVSWVDAESVCQRKNEHLIAIRSAEEQTLMRVYLRYVCVCVS